MQRALIVAMLGVAAIFLALTVVIVLEKAWREIQGARRRGRRRALEPLVLEYAHGAEVSILSTLGGAPVPGDREVVEAILLDFVSRVRGIENERLCRALAELGFVDRYLGDLRSASWWTRAEAAERLGLAGARRATPQLTVALSDPVPEVRLRAAKALGLVGGRAAVLPLIQALSEPNRWSTIRIADILAEMGREVVEELIAAFPNLNLHAKLAALEILGRIHALEAVPWLTSLLSAGERDVRARAAHALGTIGFPGAAPALRKALGDPEWPVRAMAAKALGAVRDAEAIPVVAAALRDREWWVRANAAQALRLLGPQGLASLERMLEDADLYAKHQACLALDEAGILDRRVAELASSGDVRATAEAVVSRYVAAGQIGRLRELSTTHAEAKVRETLLRLLPPVGSAGGAR